ncbi:hypothetical protein PVL29_025966 [Vitis rotundifolia]|uniref:Uncharacterized protein n=1 Tax=Vitis rotundifolia TaxID=103349 RepID=A0AA38YLD4_VITRO|nr:hypothetical protein PVL29_025966 [Vitis rotundifolia]
MVMEEKVEEEARASELESSMGLHSHGKLLSSYLGLGFFLFLALLPSSSSISQLSNLHLKFQAEQELCSFKSYERRTPKPTPEEEKRMVDQIHTATEEITCLRAKVAELEWFEAKLKAKVDELTREVGEMEKMLHEPNKISPNFSHLSFSYFPH